MPQHTAKILLIDDDTALGELLAEYLLPEGWQLEVCESGATGLELAESVRFDLIILDVMLPGLSGFEVLKALRTRGIQTPIIMLTARGEDVDRIVGLELGADDYLPKPFNPRELVARLKAILRRSSAEQTATVSTYGPWQLDSEHRRILEHGEPLPLTAAEYRLLGVLIRNAGKPASREQLTEQALGRKLLPLDRSLDTHMSNLRKKLCAAADGESPIQSIRGEGYVLMDNDIQ
jgi:two-component system response regulator CpxR